jgi:hypothetical protein
MAVLMALYMPFEFATHNFLIAEHAHANWSSLEKRFLKIFINITLHKWYF